MKRLVLPLICLLACCSCGPGAFIRNVSDERSIVVIYDNDVHCAIDAYPRFAGYRDAVVQADTAHVLTVSCGDFLQGGMAGLFSQGEYPLEIVNKVGYDAVCIGNHEFDYRLPRFRELMARLEAPVVCANLTETDGKPLFGSYLIRRCGQRKIAFVGVLTPTAADTESYAFYDEGRLLLDLNEDRLIAQVQRAIDRARRRGADYVVVLSHLGEMEPSVTSSDLIRATRGIDVLLDAHSHSTVEQTFIPDKKGKPVVVSQTGSGFKHLGKLLITSDGTISTELIPIAEITETSPTVVRTVDSVKSLYAETALQKIGTCEKTLSIFDDQGERIVRNRECAMGDFVADAYRAVCRAQVALVNGGGVRTDLEAGDITFQDIIDIQPYGNTLCLIRCQGSAILSLLEKGAKTYPDEDGSFLQVSGLRYTIDTQRVADSQQGHRIADVEILGTGGFSPLLPDVFYTLATSDYLIDLFENELGDFEYLDTAVMTDYEACVRYISEHLQGKVEAASASTDGRIRLF